MTGDAPDLYEEAVADVRLWAAEVDRLGDALEERNSAIARAWRSRPGDVTWRDLAAAVSGGGVVLTVATLRKAEAQYRREVKT